MADKSPQAILDAKQLRHAKKGILAGVLSGVLWGASGTVLGAALGFEPFSSLDTSAGDNAALSLLVAMALCGALLHDTFAALWVGVHNIRAGKFKEYGRTLRTKPGKMVCIGAILGGPIGMSGYLLGITFVNPAFALPITAAYPAVAAVLATIFFKERNPLRVWAGVLLCIAGSFVVYYAPLEGEKGVFFTVGMILTTLACLGWATEGLLSTYGMDMLDPDIALGIREGVSALAYFIFVVPVVTLFMLPNFGPAPIWELVVQVSRSSALVVYAFGGFLGGFSYVYWYRALNMTGVARAMALNVTYALWGVIFGALFTSFEPTKQLFLGAGFIAVGAILVSANPRELFKLRETN
ncbi:MAG: DMT family transporter [Deltaproteobacteria bacterium]|jgi:drug/metabolite transporter (DMT)-like permease|nr:DMT family transporter [Deltaproteobacteria bacterium]